MNDYYGPDLGSTFAGDRTGLERAAILTSWDDTEKARKLLEFPDTVWNHNAHRTAVAAIRGILRSDNPEVNPSSIMFWVREHDPDHFQDILSLEMEASDPAQILRYSGMRTHALKTLRTEYEWESAAKTLQISANGIRRMPFKDWFLKGLERFRTLMPESVTQGVRKMSDVVIERMQARMRGEVQSGHIFTGIKELDRLLRGLQGDQMPLIIGAPGSGKSSLLYQVLKNNGLASYKSLLHQQDMPVEEMADRDAIMTVGKHLDDFVRSDYEKAIEAAKFVENIMVDDRHLTLDEWETKTASILAANPDLSIVATDYAGQIEVPGITSESEETKQIAKVGRKMAKTNKICHFLLQQPNQLYEDDKWPRSRHIRGSKLLEALAHCIIFIHLPSRFDSRVPANYVQLHVLKNRGGECGIVPVLWDKPNFTMTDWPGGEILCPEPDVYRPAALPEDMHGTNSRVEPVPMEDLPV